MPLETKILLFFLYLQNIFLGYCIVQFPISTFPLIFCSKSKFKFLIFCKFSIILSLLLACTLDIKIKKILSETEVDNYTYPIVIPGGFLILKLEDIFKF